MNRSRRQRPNNAKTADRPAGLIAREGAVWLLHHVLENGRLLEDSKVAGSPPERAEARRLAEITLRRLNQIDDVLSRFVDRPPKGNGQHILRLMGAELLFHGTSPHAAVDMAVRLTKSHKTTARLSGVINAVGRRLAEQGAEIIEAQDETAMALPDWLSKKLARDWGPDVTRAIAAAQLKPAQHDLTVQNDADAEPLAHELSANILPSGSLRLRDRPQISVLPGYREGAWWVQDAAAALPAQLLHAHPGDRVLDLCAAPGGKTMQLAATGADVTALDISDRRLERVTQNLQRTGLDAKLIAADALTWNPDAPFDAILLDAPCSASGTIRRHPDLPHRHNKLDLDDLHELQLALLERCIDWLRPGGRLVFCTCSLFKSEGEHLIDQFLSSDPRLILNPITPNSDLPENFITTDGYLRTRPDQWPEHGHLDGFFAARLMRQ